MQLDRSLKPDKELNASVEFVKELSAGEFNLSDVRVTWTNMYNDEEWRTKIGSFSTWYGDSFIKEVSATRKTVTIHNFRPPVIEHPLIDMSHSQIKMVLKVIEKWNGVNHTRFDALAVDIEKYCRKVFKINKNNVMTMPNFLRMIAFINGHELQERHLKDALNAISGTADRVYLYKTQKYVAEHYARLESKADLSSCMTHGAEHFGDFTHLTTCDAELAEKAGYIVKHDIMDVFQKIDDNNEKPAVFTANVEGYSGGDFYLGLVSTVPPSRIANEEEYAFDGRVIIYQIDGEWCYSRYYGKENAGHYVARTLRTKHAGGLKFRAYRSSAPYTRDGHKTPRYIVPFIDGGRRHFTIDNTPHYDEIGREYYIATVVNWASEDINTNDLPYDLKKGQVLKLSQRTWVSEEEDWYDHCIITENGVGQGTGRYSPRLGGYVSLEFGQSDDSLNSGAIRDAIQSEINSRIDYINIITQRKNDEIKQLKQRAESLGVNLND